MVRWLLFVLILVYFFYLFVCFFFVVLRSLALLTMLQLLTIQYGHYLPAAATYTEYNINAVYGTTATNRYSHNLLIKGVTLESEDTKFMQLFADFYYCLHQCLLALTILYLSQKRLERFPFECRTHTFSRALRHLRIITKDIVIIFCKWLQWLLNWKTALSLNTSFPKTVFYQPGGQLGLFFMSAVLLIQNDLFTFS